MKKIFCLITAVIMCVFLFVGCGNDNQTGSNMMSDASQAITDAMDEAATIMDGMNNGAVSDGDGIIGNEGDEDNKNATSSSTYSSDNNIGTTDATLLTDDLM